MTVGPGGEAAMGLAISWSDSSELVLEFAKGPYLFCCLVIERV